MGFQSTLAELGQTAKLVVATDSSAAKAFASTRGLGRMRHLQVRDLWLQSLVRAGRVLLLKVRGDQNPADVMTKYLDRQVVVHQLSVGGIRVVPAGVPSGPRGGVEPRSRRTQFCVQAFARV